MKNQNQNLPPHLAELAAVARSHYAKPTARPAVEASGIRCEFLAVDPQQAMLWLKNNVKNRGLRDEHVRMIAREMTAGNWLVTHQGIAFDDKGKLIDGQHRLHGIVRSGCTVPLLVVFGLPSKLLGKKITTMDVVDRGATRSIADQLALEHELSEANLVTGICAGIIRIWTSGRVKKLSVAQVLEVFEHYKSSVVFVAKNRCKLAGLRTSGVLSAVTFAHAVHPKEVEVMFKQLNTGENLSGESPILHLRNFLLASKSIKAKGSMKTRVPEAVLHALFCAITQRAKTKFEMNAVAEEGANYFREKQAAIGEKLKGLFEDKVSPAVAAPAEAPASAAPVAPVKATAPSLDRIVLRAESAFGIDRMLILGKGQSDDMVLARTAAMVVALKLGHTREAVSTHFRRKVPEDLDAVLESFMTNGKNRGMRERLFKAFEG